MVCRDCGRMRSEVVPGELHGHYVAGMCGEVFGWVAVEVGWGVQQWHVEAYGGEGGSCSAPLSAQGPQWGIPAASTTGHGSWVCLYGVGFYDRAR